MKNLVLLFVVFYAMLICACQPNQVKSESIEFNEVKHLNDSANSTETIPPQEKAKYQIVKDIPTPEGFLRIEQDSSSFGSYLRNLKLKQENNIVHLFDGSKKGSQESQFAIIKMDVGNRDLQQCADAVMRLRAEYLFEQKKYEKIHFNFLSDGKPRYYTDYSNGDRSYKKFRKYMDHIFSYANTRSLHGELKKADIQNIMPGDVFIQTGNPYGHAVTVMDVAINEETGEKIYMLSQSYMPAQEIHILVNLVDQNISPWYRADKTNNESVFTPEWPFTIHDLRRFEE